MLFLVSTVGDGAAASDSVVIPWLISAFLPGETKTADFGELDTLLDIPLAELAGVIQRSSLYFSTFLIEPFLLQDPNTGMYKLHKDIQLKQLYTNLHKKRVALS